MLINFSSKYTSIGALIFGAYIIYQIKVNEPERINDIKSPDSPVNSRFTIEIDPNKPKEQRGFFEKLLLNMADPRYEKRLEEYQMLQNKVMLGSKVRYKYKKIDAVNLIEKDTIIDEANIKNGFENVLAGMIQGQQKYVEMEEDGKKVVYYIEIISIENK